MRKNRLPVRFTGQHFTIDKVLIADAIQQVAIDENDTVLDIGAGKGFLTVHLARYCKNVIAIELDRQLAGYLRKRFAGIDRVKIIACDFRKFKVPNQDFKVVSNIPFGISSKILKSLMFDHLEQFQGGSLVVQLEVAKKLVSATTYTPLVGFYRTFFEMKISYEISPESFLPPPTVKSALLSIKRRKVAMSFHLKGKYLRFLSKIMEKSETSTKRVMEQVFRKKQFRVLVKKYGINPSGPVKHLTVDQWKGCFIEMLGVVPEKFHLG